MIDATLAAVLERRAREHPRKLAYAEGERRLTYGELWEDANALAAGLARIGVGRGDRVAFALPAGLDFMRCFWAVQRLGASSCALNPMVPPQTIAARAARVRPAVVIRSASDIERGETSALPPLPDDAEALAFLQPTSGTSGESRTVMIRQRNVLAVLEASAEALGVGSDDVLVSWVPPWHDLGLVRFVIGTVYAGASCHIVQPAIATIPRWLETASEVRATITGAPDFAWRLATRLADPARVDLRSLRYATNGGEPVRLTTVTAFETRFGIRNVVCPAYGLAEGTLGLTTTRPGETPHVDDRGNVSCGTALPNVQVKIEADEILVRGPGVFAGYFDAPEATSETLCDGWLHTGDIGHLDAGGRLYVLGRKRAMLKRGGAVLAPRELEEAAHEVAGVRLAAAVGVARPDLATEEIVLAIEIDGGRAAADVAAAVADAVKTTLGFAPERVLVLAPRTIPRTYNGKIRHDVLRTELLDGTLQQRGALLFSSS